MEMLNGIGLSGIFENLLSFMRKYIFRVLSCGAIPNHIAFIMDGNRRYARRRNLQDGAGHRDGFFALISMLKYCFELGVKYVTVYAFSIDNFKRRPDEVQYLMDLMKEKIRELLKVESFVNRYGIQIRIVGNLNLLDEEGRLASEKIMAATAMNDKAVLNICVAYTSTDEIVHAVEESSKEKKTHELDQGRNDKDEEFAITVADLERSMYMALSPDPDILIRTSGESRLSNFLLWQTSHCHLYSPTALWPEISIWHLVWGVLQFQRVQPYLERKKKRL